MSQYRFVTVEVPVVYDGEDGWRDKLPPGSKLISATVPYDTFRPGSLVSLGGNLRGVVQSINYETGTVLVRWPNGNAADYRPDMLRRES